MKNKAYEIFFIFEIFNLFFFIFFIFFLDFFQQNVLPICLLCLYSWFFYFSATCNQLGWYEFASNGMCYKLVLENRNWIDAEYRCRSIGGHLVSISCKAENEFVKKLVGKYEAWIGLRKFANFVLKSFSKYCLLP